MIFLIIDDDLDDFHLFSSAIKIIDPAAVCINCRDGQNALNVLSNFLPDYIVLDINMPIMDGKRCLMEIKRNTKLKDVPVIMWSTATTATEINEYKRNGANDFLIKPNEFTTLCNSLSLILSTLRGQT